MCKVAYRFVVTRSRALIDGAIAGRPAAVQATGGAGPGNARPPAFERCVGRSTAQVDLGDHRTISSAFRFNRAVARVRALTNALAALDDLPGAGQVMREGLETAVRLLAPVVPHLAEEAWRRLGHDGWLASEPWPAPEAALLAHDIVVVAVQVDGKKRATISLPADHDKTAAETAAMADGGVRRALAGRAVRRVIVVPGRIVNVVT